ncbi:MAG: acetate--CoA ligase family protein [bacterium]
MQPDSPHHGLDAILRPRSVAVIGAGRRDGSIGREILKNLVRFGFEGPVHPVHPDAGHVLSMRAWPSIEAVPDPVDLAVIAVPAAQVADVVRACAARGVRGLVVITAGFREVGPAGRALEAEVLAIVRSHGMRMVGPNCMGVINADPAVNLDASFGTTLPLPGGAAFASQSGALGEVVLATARAVGLGISQFVSLGNKADVSGNDLLAFWAEDPLTRVILLYLESFGNPRHFAQLARGITRGRGKPVLAVKSGRTTQGAAAASSHTGSLAGGDRAASALFKSCGVIRCNTVAELFALARGFCQQPLPPGDRVAVLTNAGGPGIMATDAAVHFGLTMAPLAPETRADLAAVLPAEASVQNPVDMIAQATPAQYAACAKRLLADPAVDALLVIFVSPVVTDPPAVARAIVEGVAPTAGEKPVLACFMGRSQGDEGIALLAAAGIPSYPFPESAAQTLAAMAKFQAWRARPAGEVQRFAVDRARAGAIIAAGLESPHPWLSAADALALLAAYGVPTVASRTVRSPEEAIAFADEVGYPVVLKVDDPGILHKSDVGGVQVNLRSPGEIKGAFWDLRERLPAGTGDRYLVQRMLTGGQEVIVGAVADPTVGHLVMFGLGGVFVELMEDVAFGVHPLTDADAARMVREVRGWPLLAGHRGSEPADVALIEGVLLRVSQLIEDFPAIVEMDLNPFIATPAGRGGAAVDARVRLARPEGS